jgi:hypothetical protein
MITKKMKKLREEQADITDKLARLDKADKKFYMTADTTLNLLRHAKEVFKSSEPAEKRRLLNFLLQNLILKGKKLLFTLKTPFDTVLKANKCSTMGG